MISAPRSVTRLIREFSKLPGIGAKTSERFVYFLLKHNRENIDQLTQALQELQRSVRTCDQCFSYSEKSVCDICSDPTRDTSLLCVVAEPKDVFVFEHTGEYDGLYHVLGGVIDHVAGIGPQDLRLRELEDRIHNLNVQEIILATNPDAEGELTAIYIAQQLEHLNVRMTRIARGLPTGADIQFADDQTLSNALKSRRDFKRP